MPISALSAEATTVCGGLSSGAALPAPSSGKPCEGQWSGTVEAVIIGRSTENGEIYDLGKKTETTDYKLTISATANFGEAAEKAEYNKKVEAKIAGKQFCGTNAQPQYADYNETQTTTTTGMGSGAAELTVDISESTNTYSIKINPQFDYDLTTAYKNEIGAQCPANTAKGMEQNFSTKTSSGILIPQTQFDANNPNVLDGTKTVTLIDDSTAVYTWHLSRCQSCEYKAKDGNTNRPLSAGDLKAFGIDGSGGTQTIKTGAGQRLEITMHDGSILRVGPNSTVELDPCDEARPDRNHAVTIKVLLGTIWAHIEKAVGSEAATNDRYEVATERAVVGVRGTTFEVSYNPSTEVSAVKVTEGTVSFSDLNRENSIMVTGGQAAKMESDAAPTLINSAPGSGRKTPAATRKP